MQASSGSVTPYLNTLGISLSLLNFPPASLILKSNSPSLGGFPITLKRMTVINVGSAGGFRGIVGLRGFSLETLNDLIFFS